MDHSGEERRVGGRTVATKGFDELLTTPSNLTLMTPRGKTRLSGAPNGKTFPLDGSNVPALPTADGPHPDGFGSTEAEMTELVMLPAMRPAILPPFWANGSSEARGRIHLGIGDRGRGRPEKYAASRRQE